jgi:hypothetical protein
MANIYLTGLPLKFMRRSARVSKDPGDYWLSRAMEEPPEVLQLQVLPCVEELLDRFRKRARKMCWVAGGLDEDDLAGQGFLALLK